MREGYSSAAKFGVKDVSSLIGLSASTLRNIEAFFNVPIERNHLGQRVYNENDVNLFKQIKKFTAEGLQYAEIKPLLGIRVEGCSGAAPFEVVEDQTPKAEQNFNLIIKPFENRITELQTFNNDLMKENKILNRENAALEERVKNKDEIIAFQDNSINELKTKLALLENKHWWKFWK